MSKRSTPKIEPKSSSEGDLAAEILGALQQQNMLLEQILRSLDREKPSTSSLATGVDAKAIARSLSPDHDGEYVAVDLASGRFTIGPRVSAASESLGTDVPPERILTLKIGGNPRLQSPRAGAA